MVTHVAHDVVDYGLQVGKDALSYSKSTTGVLKWTVEKVEGPVCSVLDSKIGKTAIMAGDRAISVADGTIDKAMNTGAYKSTSRLVKTTYSSRILPATEKVKSTVASTTEKVKSTVASTTSAVTTPVANAYKGSLEYADATVEYMLPEADALVASEDKKLPKSVVGLTRKITRRSVRKVAATRKMIVATAAYTLEQSKPASIKKNSVALYNKALIGTDSLVDTYLPDKDGLEGKTPVMLVRKFAKRGKSHTITTIKKVATAVKNSPAMFKKAIVGVYKQMTEQAMKVKNFKLREAIKIKFVTLEDLKAKAMPLFAAMQTKGTSYVTAADKMVLNYKYTASLRNMGVSFYTSKLAHIVNPLLTRYLPAGKAASPAPKTIKSTVPTPTPAPVVVAAPLPVAPVVEPTPVDLAPVYTAPTEGVQRTTSDSKKKKGKNQHNQQQQQQHEEQSGAI